MDGTFCSFHLINTLLNTELHETITLLKISTSAAARPFTAHSHIPCRNTIRIYHSSERSSTSGKRPNGPNPTSAKRKRERRRCTTVRRMENMLISVGKNTSRWVSPSNENMQEHLLYMSQMSRTSVYSLSTKNENYTRTHPYQVPDVSYTCTQYCPPPLPSLHYSSSFPSRSPLMLSLHHGSSQQRSLLIPPQPSPHTTWSQWAACRARTTHTWDLSTSK